MKWLDEFMPNLLGNEVAEHMKTAIKLAWYEKRVKEIANVTRDRNTEVTLNALDEECERFMENIELTYKEK